MSDGEDIFLYSYQWLFLQLSAFLAGNMEYFSKAVGYRTRGSNPHLGHGIESRCHPAVEGFRQRAANYVKSINRVSESHWAYFSRSWFLIFLFLILIKYITFIDHIMCCLLWQPCPESVDYEVGLQNQKTLYSFTESRDSLAQQVCLQYIVVNV